MRTFSNDNIYARMRAPLVLYWRLLPQIADARIGPLLLQLHRLRSAGSAPVSRAGPILGQMAVLPFADLDQITDGRTALVLAPHADDESLGCGGLIAEACARGQPPVVVVLTDGGMSHPSSQSYPPDRLRALRQTEAQAAVAVLGLERERLYFLGLPDGHAPHEGPAMEQAAACVAELARHYGASTILTTWEHDPHADHIAANAIGRAAARLTGGRLVSYPVWGWALPPRQRLPVATVGGARLDIRQHLPAKRRAIAAHESQHAGLIHDDPQGFRLPASLLSAVDRPFEVFLFEK